MSGLSDGMYQYRWYTTFGWHTIFFHVKNGEILENIASQSSPVKHFEGRQLGELVEARFSKEWGFKGDSLKQVLPAEDPTTTD